MGNALDEQSTPPEEEQNRHEQDPFHIQLPPLFATRNFEFIRKVGKFRKIKNKLSRQDKLQAFSLIKQGIEGDISVSEPSFYHFQNQLKYAAWSDVKGMSRGDAQIVAVKFIGELEKKHLDPKPHLFRVDTHFHVAPDFYVKAVEIAGGHPGGYPKVPSSWDVESVKNMMHELEIKHSILSVSAPGAALFSGEEGRKMARHLNEFCSQLSKDHDYFSFFVTLPSFFDVEGVIREIEYSLGLPGAVGVICFSSYSIKDETRYLGHSSFERIWELLNQRKAVVFIHPNNGPSKQVSQYLPPPFLDYPQETTRAAADLVTSGMKSRFRSIKFILSYAGGTVPYLVNRIVGTAIIQELGTPNNYLEQLHDFRSFYYDVALSTSVPQLLSLLEIADHERILFGSDLPYAPLPLSEFTTMNLDEYFQQRGDYKLLDMINKRNAEKLFKRKF